MGLSKLKLDGSETGETAAIKINLAIDEVANKAEKIYVDNAVINTYSGTVEPADTLGHTGDRYHKFDTSTKAEVITGTSAGGNNVGSQYIILFDDSTATGVTGITIDKQNLEVLFAFSTGANVEMNDFVLNIDGTDIPLTVKQQTAGGGIAGYAASFIPTVESINVGTPFVGKAGVLSGVEQDYEKRLAGWEKRLPKMPDSDGEYKLKLVAGVATWETI